MIVHSIDPIVLVGGASLDRSDLNKSLTITPSIVAVDGGIVHLQPLGLTPSAIIGDMDSIPADLLAEYSDRLHKIADQDTTDFEKAVQNVDAPILLSLGFLGGRIDHSFAALNVITRYSDRQIILFGEQEILVRLPSEFAITLPVGADIALLPMGESQVRSEGLKWDLSDAKLAPNGLVSSSNQVASPKVRIWTDGCVLLSLPKMMLDAAIAAVRVQ